MNSKYILSMDIGGTNTRIGIVNEKYELVDKKIVPTQTFTKTNDTLRSLSDFIKEYINTNSHKISAISVGFPSTISKDRKDVLITANIPGLDNIHVVDLFEKEFGIKTFLERDATMLLSYDMHHFNIPDEGVTVGYYIGTGIGNSIFVNGQAIIGKNGCAGEVGHVPCTTHIGHCTCGNDDCFEVYCAGEAFAKICKENFPDVALDDIFDKYSNHPVIIDYVDRLSKLISIETNVLDPNYVVLGGGVLINKGFPKELLTKHIYTHTRKPYPANGLEILYSSQSQDNGIIGAGIYGFKQLDKTK